MSYYKVKVSSRHILYNSGPYCKFCNLFKNTLNIISQFVRFVINYISLACVDVCLLWVFLNDHPIRKYKYYYLK